MFISFSATVAARSQQDQSLVLEVEGGRDLVPELIGDQGLGALVFRTIQRVDAAKAPALQ